jgi:argininosuccinate lyase
MMDQVKTARRTVFRLEDIYKRTNFSPLGSATFAGTGWPVNRHRSMHILGFNGLLENTRDGVATVDYYLELLAALAPI